jgi:hypothetical protein
MPIPFRDIETRLVHCGERTVEGAVCLPIFQSAMFASRGEDGYHDVRYVRLSNTPNHCCTRSWRPSSAAKRGSSRRQAWRRSRRRS